jgi:hypothetical protein
VLNWITVLDTIARTYAGATFIFGHGKDDRVTGDVRDVTYFRDYLTAAIEHVRKGIAAGRSQEEIAALETLPGFPEYVTVAKTYSSPIPLFTLNHVLTATFQELTAR